MTRRHVSPEPRLLARFLMASVLAAVTVVSFARGSSDIDPGFDELLALPQHLPEGSEFPSLQDGSIVDEKSLQQALENGLDVGANINAYRYGGTLLHHALRGNLQDTALWLLAHGADPKLEVQDVESGKTDGRDALQLAIVYRRWRVVDALVRRQAVTPHSARDLAFRWSGVFDLFGDAATVDDAARQLARRLPWPGDWYGGCLAAAAQDRAVLPMLEKAAGAAPVRRRTEFQEPLKGRDLDVASLCVQPVVRFAGEGDTLIHVPGRFAKLAPAELSRIDAHLAEPLLPALATLLDTPADAQAWAALPLRRPWQDPAFARAAVQALLRTPMEPAVRDAALRTLPPAALRAALDDDATLRAWFERLLYLPLPQASATLAAIDDATLARHADAAVAGLAGVPLGVYNRTPYSRQSRKAPEQLWLTMLSRLPPSQQWRPDLSILTLTPVSTWSLLFARGYMPTPVRLQSVWLVSTFDEWRDLWPRLQAVVHPDAATAMVAGILANWAKPCDDDICIPHPDDAAKLRRVLAAGVRPPPAVTLSSGAARRAAPQTVEALLATHLVTLPPGDTALAASVAAPPPDVPPRGRLERTPLACAPEPDGAIVHAALHETFLANGNSSPPSPHAQAVQPDWFQPVAEPGAKACAWLVSGGEVASRGSFDEDDFYEGHHHFSPCGDATLYGEVWHMVGGRLVATPWEEGATGGAVQLADAGGARRFVLALPFRGGTCDAGRHAMLFEWVGVATDRHLVRRADDGPTRLAFDAECDADDPAPCFGLPSQDDGAIQPDTPESMLLQSTFVERYGGALRQRWLDAFVAGDVAALRSPDMPEPMPEWRQAALAALTASALPLDQKRQRTAWMFRDKAGMAASFGPAAGRRPEVLGLVGWLPREDWRPMLAAIGQDENLLMSLRDAATAKGDARLACTFAQAAGRDCAVPSKP